MAFLKIITCAFSMGFCLMSISSLGDFLVWRIFDTSSVWDDDPIEWLQQKCIYFAFLWIFFCEVCAVLAAKLKDSGRFADFFVDLFLPTVAVLILLPLIGIAIAMALGRCGRFSNQYFRSLYFCSARRKYGLKAGLFTQVLAREILKFAQNFAAKFSPAAAIIVLCYFCINASFLAVT